MVMNLIKYPNSINKNYKKLKNYANRGMTLEHEINETNKYYLENNIAVIYKKPTPIQVVKQVGGKIIDAYFISPSTTDYNGIYKSNYVDFEAKETTSKTSFPLSNIHPHQIKHIKNILSHKGICFLIVRFSSLDETYLLFGFDFINYIENTSKKSIPLKYFKEKGHFIQTKFNPRIDYIRIIEEYLEVKK